MALTRCPDCGKEISSEALACPNCGRPMDSAVQNVCPKCGSREITYQREQTAKVGISQNKVTHRKAKRSKGCLYWLMIGWWVEPLKFIMFDWWYYLFFGGRKKSGWNLSASKAINHTVAVCQTCGHSWKVKKD